jgi:hypothetical protein
MGNPARFNLNRNRFAIYLLQKLNFRGIFLPTIEIFFSTAKKFLSHKIFSKISFI